MILDSSGYTKGYGFVRFGNEEEQRNALYAMNGYTGLGTKPLKICTAVPKPKGAVPNQNQSAVNSSAAAYNSGAVWCKKIFNLLTAFVTLEHLCDKICNISPPKEGKYPLYHITKNKAESVVNVQNLQDYGFT